MLADPELLYTSALGVCSPNVAHGGHLAVCSAWGECSGIGIGIDVERDAVSSRDAETIKRRRKTDHACFVIGSWDKRDWVLGRVVSRERSEGLSHAHF